MTDRNNRNSLQDKHPFIKETIKEPPSDRKSVAKKLLLASVCGVLFGACAVATMVLFYPGILQKIEDSTGSTATVTLSPEKNKDEQEKETTTENTDRTETQKENKTGIQHSDAQMSDILSIAEESRKALVRVAAFRKDADLLDDSFLDYGDEEGLVFLKNADAFYILTVTDNTEDAGTFQVTFSNGTSAEGKLCKKDSRTGFMVLSVPVEKLSQQDIEEIPAATLDVSGQIKQMQQVIAIGSPAGNYDSLVTGTVTSTSGRLKVADEEYTLFSTDMVGNKDGDGALLNLEGKVVGIIYQSEEENTDVIRAVPVSQISSLLEVLANRQEICYIGIQGATISQIQSSNLEIPLGIYVNSVEANSPAMSSGIQNGDIIHTLGDTEITTMEEYSEKLQSMNAGTRTTVSLYRRTPSGEYVNVILNISIKEK